MDEAIKRLAQAGVGEMTVVVECAVRPADRELAVDSIGADDSKYLARFRLAQTAPKRPVEAPITATGLPRRAFSGNGRDAQSCDGLSGTRVRSSPAGAPAVRR
jgi:hypothetical protein